MQLEGPRSCVSGRCDRKVSIAPAGSKREQHLLGEPSGPAKPLSSVPGPYSSSWHSHLATQQVKAQDRALSAIGFLAIGESRNEEAANTTKRPFPVAASRSQHSVSTDPDVGWMPELGVPKTLPVLCPCLLGLQDFSCH